MLPIEQSGHYRLTLTLDLGLEMILNLKKKVNQWQNTIVSNRKKHPSPAVKREWLNQAFTVNVQSMQFEPINF